MLKPRQGHRSKIGNWKRNDGEDQAMSRRGSQGRAGGRVAFQEVHVFAPGPSALAAGRGAERASRTAYQNRSAETLAGLAHPACQPGGLPGAFSVLAHGDG